MVHVLHVSRTRVYVNLGFHCLGDKVGCDSTDTNSAYLHTCFALDLILSGVWWM